MSDQEKQGFEGWAILELMGHRRLGGHVRTTELAGAPFFRIDVPSADGARLATQFYSPAAVYCMTPTTEETARAVARLERPAPVHRYELEMERRPVVHADADGDEELMRHDEDEDEDES